MLYLTLVWLDDPHLRPEVWTREFQAIAFRPLMAVREVAARVDATFEGPGRYEFELWSVAVRTWDGSHQRRSITRTYLNVEG